MPYIVGTQTLFPQAENIDAIETSKWIEAAEGAVKIVHCMGGQFSMTETDMLGNIKKIRTRYETDTAAFESFKNLLQYEKDNKEDKKDSSGTVGGLWLKRGLEYLCEIFWELIQEHDACKKPGGKSDSGAVKSACKKAYEKTLTKYHNMAVRMVVKGGMMASPYKETLMANLANGEKGKEDEVVEEMKAYEASLRAFMIVVGQLFNTFDYKDDCLENVHS
ncbi:glycolipid transfer protein-like [Mercenaria mercenaria]|uniref:glycolipid transfer protein-like n=1 Tax=Mercenaria mercenaria TaxID=6596 RepID=UPI001E1D9B4C|nr:glycolipid transfer protein-like [Mercenaria mercenaria]